jgi:enamine deaminase RidA (YjgF/YER057c/UK114 family)
MIHHVLQPAGWARPKGYSNGVMARGRQIYIAGQIGWDGDCRFVEGGFSAQVRQALANIVAILGEAGAGPEHLVRLTWYVTSRAEYLNEIAAVGQAYRETIGKHFPAMAVVEVTALMEAEAKVEIEATAVIPDEGA